MGSLELGHRPSAAPPPPPARRETRDEMKPPAAFRIPVGRGRLWCPGDAPVGDLGPDNPVARPDRDRGRLAEGA